MLTSTNTFCHDNAFMPEIVLMIGKGIIDFIAFTHFFDFDIVLVILTHVYFKPEISLF